MGKKSNLEKEIEALSRSDDWETAVVRGCAQPLEAIVSESILEWSEGFGTRPIHELQERAPVLEALCKVIAKSTLDRLHELVIASCGSPIEELFLYGLVFGAWSRGCEVILSHPARGQNLHLGPSDYGRSQYSITVQPEIDQMHPDFLVRAEFPPLYRVRMPLAAVVAVECDGHDFHEKTKEQARRDKARDRQLSASGNPVLRFTGSEIHKAPIEKGLWVIDHLKHLAYRPAFEALFREFGWDEVLRQSSFNQGQGHIKRDTGWTLEEWVKRLGLEAPGKK